jgi:hypothetical protein
MKIKPETRFQWQKELKRRERIASLLQGHH